MGGESCRRDSSHDHEDTAGDDDGGVLAGVPLVGYARKQAKSNAFFGPRRTPISCKIKKKIIKAKRKKKKEQHQQQQQQLVQQQQQQQHLRFTSSGTTDEEDDSVRDVERHTTQRTRSNVHYVY